LKFSILVWQELHRHCTRIRAVVGIYRISIPRQCNELKTSMANFIPCPDPNPDLSPVHKVLHVHVGLYSYQSWYRPYAIDVTAVNLQLFSVI